MFAEERVLAIIGVIVLALLIPTGLVVLGSKTVWKESSGKALQIFGIVLCALAIVVALIGLGAATIWKGPSGEWARVALIPAFLVNLPSGLIALVIGLAVRGGVPRMRRICIAMSVIALLSPFVAALLA